MHDAGNYTVNNQFLMQFGRVFITSLFLERRLTLANTVSNFDYEKTAPQNELQALYLDQAAQHAMLLESTQTSATIWLDSTRGNLLCLRVSDTPKLSAAEDRLQPSKMRLHHTIEDEGDGFKSYMGICIALLLGRRPVCVIDEPEMCLHPPQAYALGRFIGRHGTSLNHTTIVATHSSHVLRGIIEEAIRLEIIRLSRSGVPFSSGSGFHKKSLRTA